MLLASSCRTSQSSTSQATATHTSSDSIRVVDHYISVPVLVPGDTTRVSIPVDCDSLGRLHSAGLSSQSQRASVRVVYVSTSASAGVLDVESDCNAYIDSIHVLEQNITEIKARRDSLASVKVTVVQVKYIPAIYKCALALWIVLLIAALTYAVTKIYLKYKP